MIENRLLSQLVFWGVWLVIPLIWEIIGAVGAAAVVAARYVRGRWLLLREEMLCVKCVGPDKEMDAETAAAAADSSTPAGSNLNMDLFYPVVTIIVPVYNSEHTLGACLQSIIEQNYPLDRLEILLVDNGSSDGGRRIFERFQEKNGGARLWWITSGQGKSRALNMGVFSGTGKYIVNIDSDGWLDRQAIARIVSKFEGDAGIAAMTGVVLTDIEKADDMEADGRHAGNNDAEYKAAGNNQNGNSTAITDKNPAGRLLQLVRQCEFFEYCESFLVGRSFQSIYNNLNTLAGAFSCFRREILMKTQLYNTETMGEDAHMTSQVREFAGGRVVLCDDAFYFTKPVESLDKLYTQRQRWQRAELEVAGLFRESHLGGAVSFFRKSAMRRLVSNHTLAFPRLIWLFAIVYLYFINYPLKLIVGANLLLYAAYVMLAVLNISVACLYLGNQRKIVNYLLKHMHVCLAMPLYRFVLYWMRLAGIINSLTTPSKWRTRTFSEEMTDAGYEAGKAIRRRLGFMYALKRRITSDKEE